MSRDVTFHEAQAYFTQPYLQGESLREDKGTNLETLILPDLNLETLILPDFEPNCTPIDTLPTGRQSLVVDSIV